MAILSLNKQISIGFILMFQIILTVGIVGSKSISVAANYLNSMTDDLHAKLETFRT